MNINIFYTHYNVDGKEINIDLTFLTMNYVLKIY